MKNGDREKKVRKGTTARAKKGAASHKGKASKSVEVFGLSRAALEIIREDSYRLEIPFHKLKVAVAATHLRSEAFGVVETLVRLSQEKSHEEILEKAARSSSDVLNRLVLTDEDPLAEVDEATHEEVLQGLIKAELESRKRREKLLASCVGVDEAARLAARTRQRLEELRRKGKLLALRVKNRWMYPRWQFDPDFTGGVVPGIKEVLSHLYLSPAGAATWFTESFEDLGNRKPINLLKAGRLEKVVELAEEHGHMP